ncbi:hypothetical protein HYH03_019091, partial [Edaphochlamys debaryana]
RLAPLADRGLLYSLEQDPRSSNQSLLATSERLPDPMASPWLHAGVLALALLIAGLLGLLLRSREQALDANQRLAVANAKADRALQTLDVLFAEMGKIEDLVTAVQRGGGPEVVKLRGQMRRVMRTFEEAQSPGAGTSSFARADWRRELRPVYKAYWRENDIERGPFGMSGDTDHDQKAIKEVAFRLSHPNIVRLIHADIQPLPESLARSGSSGCEVLLILELCDLGSLRDALDLGAFRLPASTPAPAPGPSLQEDSEDSNHAQAQGPDQAQAQAQGGLNYLAVLDAAIDVACAMAHLHGRRPCVVHGDLKPANVLLASTCTGMGAAAWNADTHGPRGPAVRQSVKAADVYSYGIMLWELYTGQRPFAGVAQERLVAQVADASTRLRPQFPPGTPGTRRHVAPCPALPGPSTPTFAEILKRLEEMRGALPCPAPPLQPFKPRRPAADGAMAAEASRVAAGPIAPALTGMQLQAPATVSRADVR